ncbi:MAG TPA: hypothetical protein VMT74_01165 [Gaiellaceae bacterium]|nr:hypothetical protein [Gaiellaceae bacterium]
MGATRFLAAAAMVLAGGATPAAPAPSCPAPTATSAYTREVARALAARTDVWGDALLAARGGPTYAGAARYLQPLLYARGPGGAPLTASGVYYLPFGLPDGADGTSSVFLHVADGSQVVARHAGGRALTALVGAAGGERYGSCLARLTPATLAGGYLPILETEYADAAGDRYTQESFAGRLHGKLAAFVRVTADARAAAATIRFTPSPVAVTVPRGETRTVAVAWSPSAGATTIDAAAYDAARKSVVDYWNRRLAEGMTISVPEERVEDAWRALLVQDLVLTWRYSIGNPYEEFSFPEGVDVAQVLAEQGFRQVARAILTTSLTRPTDRYPNWKRGERLLASAEYDRLFRDTSYVDGATPALQRYVTDLGKQIDASSTGLLGRERYSSDIADSVLGLHTQAVAWAGLRGMADVWAETGHASLAATSRRLAARLEAGLRRAVPASERRLGDGSLFLPARLLDDEKPYGSLVEARSGSYWNLVVPYALASGLFAPGSTEATGAWRYMTLHGSRLLGLVRAGAYALYGRSAAFPVSGTDEVYGINVARFLADDGLADQLVLSLYGELAAAMTPGTFVSGEGASIAPLHGEAYRSMYLPPNGASNGAFLETLRLMLVHETRDAAGVEPRGLQLAYATPRAWLEPGKRIAVGGAPTSFGPVSFSIDAGDRSAKVTVEAPRRSAPASLSIRLRLPHGERLTAVTLAGRPWTRFDPSTGAIDLSGRSGTLALEASYR